MQSTPKSIPMPVDIPVAMHVEMAKIPSNRELTLTDKQQQKQKQKQRNIIYILVHGKRWLPLCAVSSGFEQFSQDTQPTMATENSNLRERKPQSWHTK